MSMLAESGLIGCASKVHVSIVIPAYNEEALLPMTLASVNRARELMASWGGSSDVTVVDNQSTDRTAVIGRRYGARVFSSNSRSIGGVRNDGAFSTCGDILLFLDADTVVAPDLLVGLACVMGDGRVVGGAVQTELLPRKKVLRPYLAMWRRIASRYEMAQGIAQFVRRDAFDTLGGFDDELLMAEDIEFYWRLREIARGTHGRIEFLTAHPVRPSTRRLDTWPVWKTLLLTSPMTVVPLRVKVLRPVLRSRWLWRGWYSGTVR